MCPTCLLGGFSPSEKGTASSTATQLSGGAAAFALTSDELQELFPDLEILDLLGVGGMGAVYLARQTRLERVIALKVLSCSPDLHEDFSLRFEQEARVLAKLSHPNIVGLYDMDELEGGGPDGLPLFYFSMEYVEGGDLRKRLHEGAVPADVVLSIAGQLCDALQYAHGVGVVHRDIKPANILVSADDQVKIADFGVARIVQSLTAVEEGTRLTRTGTSLGTPQYTAPEQWDDSEKADHRADIFSLGVLLYEMLTGERAVGVFDPPSHHADVDEAVDALVLRSMHRDPERRFADVGELKRALDEVRHQRRAGGGSRRHSEIGEKKIVAVIGAAVALVLLTLWLFRDDRDQAAPGAPAPKPAPIVGPVSAELASDPGHRMATARPAAELVGEAVCSPGRLRSWGQLDNGNSPAVGLAGASGVDDFVAVTASSDGPWAARRSDGSYITYGFEAFVAGEQWARLDYLHSTCPAGLTSDGQLWCIENDSPRRLSGRTEGDRMVGFASGSHLAYSIDQRGVLDLHFLASSADSLALNEGLVGKIRAHLSSLEDVIQISASNTNAIALTKSGEVISWHLGLGLVPTPPQVVDVVRVDCGAHDYYAVNSRGELITWSAQVFDSVQLAPPDDLGKVVGMRVGLAVCAVQFEDGTWRAWQTRRESERLSVRYQYEQQLIEKINSLGLARDLVFFAKNEGALLYWIEPVESKPGERG